MKKSSRSQDYFERFIQPGVLGFYRSASVMSVMLHDKANKCFHNLYTLVTMQEFPGRKIGVLRHGTLRPLHVNKQFSVMIVFQDVTIEIAKQLYRSASGRGEWRQPGSSAFLKVEELSVLSPQFVPLNPPPAIHHGLKNPYRSCHYLLELFAEEKKIAAMLTEKERRKIAEWVRQSLPIDLQLLSDRWGNIVFQFPVTLLKVQSRGNGMGTHVLAHLAWHPNIAACPPVVLVEVYVNNDGVIQGYGFAEGATSNFEIDVGSTVGQITLSVKRKQDTLLLFQQTSSLLHHMVFDFHWSFHEKRRLGVPTRSNNPSEEFHLVDLLYFRGYLR